MNCKAQITRVDKSLSSVIQKEKKNNLDLSFKTFRSTEKVENGVLSFNLLIENNIHKRKILMFIVNYNTTLQMCHLTIVNGDSPLPRVLFVCSETLNDLEGKIEKYVPKIVESATNILRK